MPPHVRYSLRTLQRTRRPRAPDAEQSEAPPKMRNSIMSAYRYASLKIKGKMLQYPIQYSEGRLHMALRLRLQHMLTLG